MEARRLTTIAGKCWPRWLCAAACCASLGCQQQAGPLPATGEHADSEKLSRGRIAFIAGYQAGREQVRQQSKPMLVFFTASWCHYCHAMADDAFCQDMVVALSDRFVCVLVDADAEPEVCRQFRVRSFPTVQFLSAQGVPLNRVTGKQPAEQLSIEMQAALQAVVRRVPKAGDARSF